MDLHNRIYRSRRERMVAGVAGGLAQYFGIDPTILRLLLVAALLTTGPFALVAYFVCALIMPREPETTFV
ncbi:MAG TPA: PspC domain-containing protein [Chloroflexota bacterium]|jgi:phage shock protein C|nr:PspC domain-containing protein [Chloroflexota bacterium]